MQAGATNKAPSLVSDSEYSPAGSGNESNDTDADETSSDRASDDENDDTGFEDTTHASMTLPCVRFAPNRTPLLVTIALMNDVDPEKRCFHCVFAPDPNREATDEEGQYQAAGKTDVNTREIIGEIRRISHRNFANLL